MPGRNFRAIDDDAQVGIAKRRSFGQTHFEGAERAIAGIFEFIDDVKMDASRRRAGNANLGLAIGKMITRAKGMDAARQENCPCPQDNRE